MRVLVVLALASLWQIPRAVAATTGLSGPPAGTAVVDSSKTGTVAGGAGCPMIHVYLDVSGSVLKPLADHGQQTGYALALAQMRDSIAPHIDGMGATLYLYRFGSGVDDPIAFNTTAAFLKYVDDLARTPPAPRGATNLTRVWEDILDRARGQGGPQSFLVFSDFAQSSIATPKTSRMVPPGGPDAGEDLKDWRVFLAQRGDAIRATVDAAYVRLVRLPAERQYQIQQMQTLKYLINLGSRVRTRVVDVAAPDWEEFGKQTRYVDLQIEGDRLRLRNTSCAPVFAESLRLRAADGTTRADPRPPLRLGRGESGYWDMPAAGAVRAGVIGKVGVLEGLLSDELSFGLRNGDLSAYGFLFGRGLQVFITPTVSLGEAVDADVEVLVSTDAGEAAALKQRVRIPPNAEAHAAPLRGTLSPADDAAVSAAERVRLRLTPHTGGPVEVADVPIRKLPGVRFDMRWVAFVVGLLGFVACMFWARVSGWRMGSQLLTGGSIAIALATVGHWSVDIDSAWVGWLCGGFAVLVGAWCGWCTTVTALPTERRSLRDIVAEIDAQEAGPVTLLRRWVYTRARLFGLVVALVVGCVTGLLLKRTYIDLGEQRLPLELLRKVVEGVLTGQG